MCEVRHNHPKLCDVRRTRQQREHVSQAGQALLLALLRDDYAAVLVAETNPYGEQTMTETAHLMRRYREVAVNLWDIIDDIDTADDAFKENHAGYQKYVTEKVKERFQWMRPTKDTQGLRLTQPSKQ